LDDRRPDHRDNRRRRDDSRERPRKHDDKPKAPERKFIEPRTPSNSPPRERVVDNNETTEVPMTINYGNIIPPPLKRRQIGGPKKTVIAESKPLSLRIEKEDGEVSDNDAEKKTVKNA
jgi:hypothetical protein